MYVNFIILFCFHFTSLCFSNEEEAILEDGELKEEELHPLATVSNINPEDIPDVPVNKFLMRGNVSSDRRDDRKKGSIAIIKLSLLELV